MDKSPLENGNKAKSLKKSKSKEKVKPKTTVKKKKDKGMPSKPKNEVSEGKPETPKTSFYLFCKDKIAHKAPEEEEYSFIKLAELYEDLKSEAKEKYIKKSEEMKEDYAKKLAKFKKQAKDDEEKKENKKKKAKTSKADMKKNSKKICDCASSNGSNEDEK